MAMKFWFGKKETEQDAPRGVACDVLSFPERMGNGGTSLAAPSQLFVAPPRAATMTESKVLVSQQLFSAGAARQEAVPPAAAAGGAPAANPPAAAAPFNLPAAPAEAVSAPPAVPAAGAPAPAAAQPPVVLKPVGAPVRLTAHPAGAPAATPAGAVAPAAVPAAAGAAHAAGGASGRPAFALRSKTETGTIAEAKGIVEREVDGFAIRPKVDQRALYYQLMNGLYDAVLVLDDQGHVVDCNTRVTEMLGYSREEAWDLPIDKVITGMSSQMFEHLKRNLVESHHILIDARCFRQDGTSFAGEVGVSMITLTRGSNMVFAVRNVERRKSAMDELRKSHAALDIALAPAFTCDTDGFFVVVNPAFLEAFGIPDEGQAKGVRFADLLPDAAQLFLRATCGEKVRDTLRVPTPDGVPLKLQIALMPVQSGKTVTGVAGSILQM